MNRLRILVPLLMLGFANVSYAAYLNVSPLPVVVPAGQSTTNVTISWGDAFSTTCVWWNGDPPNNNYTPWGPQKCGGGSGSTTAYALTPGKYKFWITNGSSPGGIGAEIKFLVESAPANPVGMFANPNPVTIPAGQSSTNFTLSWNWPGYSKLDVWVTVDAAPNALCLGQVNGPSGSSSNVGIGSRQREIFYLVPSSGTGCKAGSVWPSIPTPILTTLTVTTTN